MALWAVAECIDTERKNEGKKYKIRKGDRSQKKDQRKKNLFKYKVWIWAFFKKERKKEEIKLS